jgi:hypothetical protein
MAEIKTLEDVNQLALKGNQRALEELSGAAFGGSSEARRMISQIESKNIVFKDVEEVSKISKRSNLRQIIFHPLESLRTKAIQELVGGRIKTSFRGYYY